MSSARRRGRPPGKRDTRELILRTARAVFAEHGYDGTSLRQIATVAGVDAALIHHYFSGKEQLFLAAVQFPVDLDAVLGSITAGPLEQLGARFANTFLAAWEDPTSGPALEAFLRGALASREAGQLVQAFFAAQIIQRVLPALRGVVAPDEIPTRATLCVSQLLGVALVRHILRFEPLASMPRAQVCAAIAPTLQRYLTGNVDDLLGDTPPPVFG